MIRIVFYLDVQMLTLGHMVSRTLFSYLLKTLPETFIVQR
jgi:hypothetical protein